MIPHVALYPLAVAEWLARGLTVGGILLALALGGWDAATSDEALTQRLERNIQADFVSDLAAVRGATPDALVAGARQLRTRSGAGPGPIHLRVSTSGKLAGWSTNYYIPPANVLEAQLSVTRDELLIGGRSVYYNVKVYTDTAVYFNLLPLKLQYPVQNEYLTDFIYLGRYGGRGIELENPSRQFSLLPIKGGINITDPEKRHLFSIRVVDTHPFRHAARLATGVGALLALVGGGLWLYLWLRRSRRPVWVREAFLISALGGTRLVLLWLGLPTQYLELDIFSPHLLALNALSPSLGDLTLNVVLLLIVAVRLYQLARTLPDWLSRRVQGRAGWWAVHLVALGVACLLYSGFFGLFDLLTVNSKAEFEFADIYQLSGYSLLLFLNVALVLVAILLVLFFLAGVSQALPSPYGAAWPYAVLLCLGASVVFGLLGGGLLEPLTFVGFVGLVYLVHQRNGYSLRLSLVNALLLIAGLAALTNHAITKSLRRTTDRELAFYAAKYADQKDWLTEYIFDEVASTLTDDRSLWQPAYRAGVDSQQVLADLPGRIITQYLATSFRGYDYQVALTDTLGRTWSGPETAPGYRSGTTPAENTLSRFLKYVPATGGGAPHYYVGTFAAQHSWVGPLTVQIELRPKSVAPGQLYPQLLVDRSVQQQMGIPEKYMVGYYVNGQLERRHGVYGFPVTLANPPEPGTTRRFSEGGYQHYQVHLGQGRVVYALAHERNLFDRITAFSFLYYFFVLLYGLISIPRVLEEITELGLRPYAKSFAFRIQFFLALFSLAPLAVLGLLISPRFSVLYQQDAEAGLKQGLVQVSGYLRQAPLPAEAMLSGAGSGTLQENNWIRNASNLLSTDINVYDLRGQLVSTSRPKFYQVELTSRYMNPAAYRVLKTNRQSELILREQVGQLPYLSGYTTLRDDKGRVVGFLNLPWLARHGLLESQVRSFAAYLANLYVILMLGIIVGGLFITRTLTNPLKLLKQKMDQTNLGMPYEQLEWHSRDEIGAIIGSYNQMLQKLESQEKKLARTERELAWREMARQVAHEIKNPLTPMKLSIQHLMRMLQRGGREADPSLQKVTGTLLAQIDSLNSIASSFSTFATMPQDRHSLVELQTVVNQAVELYYDAEEAELSFEVPETPVYVLGDRDQLTRILINLIRNALQAMTLRGRIHLRLYEEGTRATIVVSDTGKGIPIAIQSRIFEPNFSTKNSGMGLGLAITKRLVENMDGTITFESEVGVGTTFYIRFPIILPEPEAAPELSL